MKLIEKMTINPAKLYNLDKGYIKEGADADIVIFSEDDIKVYDEFVSKSKNSPFKDKSLYGKVKYTICSGKVVYESK